VINLKLKLPYIIVFLIPVFIFVGIMYYMLGWSAIVSSMKWIGMTPIWNFAGIYNYQSLYNSSEFWLAFKNNIIWLIAFVIPTGIVGLIMAYLFEYVPRKLSSLLKSVFLYPLVISPVVAGVVWAWIFDPQYGIASTIFSVLNVHLGWLGDPAMATFCLIIAGIWQELGFALVLYIAAIGEIPREHVEAAKIDGASYWAIFVNIVIPEVGHATLIVFSLLVLYSLQVFTLVWVMTSGGPGTSTEVLPYMMYKVTFDRLMVGQGAAISMVIFAISIIVLIPISISMMRRWMS
jgi:ABC-type sugar transport system permease subunit